jgi:hypothetical protein
LSYARRLPANDSRFPEQGIFGGRRSRDHAVKAFSNRRRGNAFGRRGVE